MPSKIVRERAPCPHIRLPFAYIYSDCKNAAPFTKGKPYILSQALTEEEEALVKQQLIKAGVRLAAVLNQAAQQTPPAAAKKTKSKSPGN